MFASWQNKLGEGSFLETFDLRRAKSGRLFYESKYNPDKLPKSIC